VNRVQAWTHTLVTIALIVAYVVLQVTGSDSTLIGGALLGYIGSGAAQLVGGKIGGGKP